MSLEGARVGAVVLVVAATGYKKNRFSHDAMIGRHLSSIDWPLATEAQPLRNYITLWYGNSLFDGYYLQISRPTEESAHSDPFYPAEERMATPAPTVSKQTFYITILLVFIAGFLAGTVFTVYRIGSTPTASGPAAAPETLAKEQEHAIQHLEGAVTKNPEDVQAWTQLAHLYFDTDQVQKAIGAYQKALELKGDDADLWTDLGVMYRRSNDPQKALEAFDKAAALDPNHLQSRFNRGIVLHFDLGRTDEALTAWQSVLALNNDYRMANNRLLREFIETVKSEQQP